MKIQIQKEAFIEAMRLVGTVVPGRSPKPVLECVRLAAEDGTVTVHGTDLDTSVRYGVSAEVQEPGEVLIRSSLLNSIVRAAESDVLVLNASEDHCEIVEQDARYNLYTLASKDSFPLPPEDDDEFDAVMPLAEFRAGVKRTEFAAARETTRYAINGVFLKQGKGQARLVATDGRRLACCQVKEEAEMESKGIVPPKAMRVLSALVGDEGEIKVKVRERQAWFECGPLSMTTNLMEGTFPNYEDIIPKDCPIKLTMNTSAAIQAIRQASIMLPVDGMGIVMSLSKNKAVFQARDGKKVVGESSVPVEYAEKKMDVCFSPSIVTDALRVIGAETFVWEIKEPQFAMKILGPDDYTYVFMPITMD